MRNIFLVLPSAILVFSSLLLPVRTEAKINFAPPATTKDGKIDSTWAGKMDFAKLESLREYQISRDDLDKLTVDDLAKFDEEQTEQLYARLSSGPIPDGKFKGRVLMSRGGILTQMSNILNKAWLADIPMDKFLGLFWEGKTFHKAEGSLTNNIELNEPQRLLINLIGKFTGGRVSRNMSEDSILKILRDRDYQLFAAKIFCGQSLLDSRRESVLIDYAYGDDVKSRYNPEIDFLAGRNGFMFRDELRMVKPGMYLGRGYINRIFLLNFVLYRDEPKANGGSYSDASYKDECWSGTQARGILARGAK